MHIYYLFCMSTILFALSLQSNCILVGHIVVILVIIVIFFITNKIIIGRNSVSLRECVILVLLNCVSVA